MVKCLCAQLCHSDNGKLLVCLEGTTVNCWHAQVCHSDNGKLLACFCQVFYSQWLTVLTTVKCWSAQGLGWLKGTILSYSGNGKLLCVLK